MMEIGRRFHRQSELFNVVVFSGRAVRQSQQKVRRNLEVIRDGDDVFAGQLIRLFGHKAAERTLVDAQSLRQLGLRDGLAPAQIADSVPQRPRKPFFLHQSILPRYLVDCIIPDVTCKVKPVAFLQQKPVPTPMG